VTRLQLDTHPLAVAELATDGNHLDLFARLLVCQSRTEPMLLLTADRHLRRSGTPKNLVA